MNKLNFLFGVLAFLLIAYSTFSSTAAAADWHEAANIKHARFRRMIRRVNLRERLQCYQWGCVNWKKHFKKCQTHCTG